MVLYGGDEVSALVFDFGSKLSKIGYAGEELPRNVFSSNVGYAPDPDAAPAAKAAAHTQPESMDVDGQPPAQRRRFVGDTDVFRWRSGLELRSPFSGGVVSDWDALEALWEHSYASCLRVEPTDHPLLFAEASWNPRDKRERLCELAFEKYQTPAFYLGRNAVLSAFAAGKSTALVVDSGASTTSVVPVHDGYVLKKAIQKSPFGGDFVTDQIELYLKQMGIEVVPQYLVVKKERTDPLAPARFTRADRPNTHPSFHKFAADRALEEFKETVSQIPEKTLDERLYKKRAPKSFEFPNGYNQPFGIERYRCIEGLFQPAYILGNSSSTTHPKEKPADAADAEIISDAATNDGTNGDRISTVVSNTENIYKKAPTFRQLIHTSISMCDPDLHPHLYLNVVLTGGNTLLPGFPDRLYNELHADAPGNKVKVSTAGGLMERRFGAWIGGSILASLGSFHQLWISKQQYDEIGPSVERRIH